ncbi:hypothetical protein SAMN05421869_115103 [Nonomuraea jiangxiensis]|uniref:AMP-binding enzyme n=1 Tax=Nonomuraea jiangxiensis TaxID=633440 RepID=A0A1G9B1Q4_9ACTN|nr:hypothetical protein SAMN05421869_115103 [Nonomuraea jiangxiensis]
MAAAPAPAPVSRRPGRLVLLTSGITGAPKGAPRRPRWSSRSSRCSPPSRRAVASRCSSRRRCSTASHCSGTGPRAGVRLPGRPHAPLRCRGRARRAGGRTCRGAGGRTGDIGVPAGPAAERAAGPAGGGVRRLGAAPCPRAFNGTPTARSSTTSTTPPRSAGRPWPPPPTCAPPRTPVGRPPCGTTVRIPGQDGAEQPTGEVGRVLVGGGLTLTARGDGLGGLFAKPDGQGGPAQTRPPGAVTRRGPDVCAPLSPPPQRLALPRGDSKRSRHRGAQLARPGSTSDARTPVMRNPRNPRACAAIHSK